MSLFKKNLFLFAVLAIAVLSCDKDDDEMVMDPPNDPPQDTTTTPPATPLPSTYLIADGDSFWLVTSNPQPIVAGLPYRYQMNFGTRAQLMQNVTEPGANSTFGLVMSFSDKPTADTDFSTSSDRFMIGTTEVNYYMSWFINTGHPRAGDNFLSPDNGTFSTVIGNGKLTGTLPALTFFGESDSTDTYTVEGVIDLNW